MSGQSTFSLALRPRRSFFDVSIPPGNLSPVDLTRSYERNLADRDELASQGNKTVSKMIANLEQKMKVIEVTQTRIFEEIAVIRKQQGVGQDDLKTAHNEQIKKIADLRIEHQKSGQDLSDTKSASQQPFLDDVMSTLREILSSQDARKADASEMILGVMELSEDFQIFKKVVERNQNNILRNQQEILDKLQRIDLGSDLGVINLE